VFRESVAPLPPPADPVQLSLPPWSEEEGERMKERRKDSEKRGEQETDRLDGGALFRTHRTTRTGASASSGGVCRLVTSSGDCRITIRCFALPDRLAQLLDTHPYEVRSLVSELAQDAGAALAGSTTSTGQEGGGEGGKGAEEAETEEEEEEEAVGVARSRSSDDGHDVSSMRTLSRISQEGRAGGGAEARRPFREQVEEALLTLRPEPTTSGDGGGGGGGGGGGDEGGAAKAVAAAGGRGDADGGKDRLDLASVLAFGPRNMGPNALFVPPGFGVRILWSAEVEGAEAGAVHGGGGGGGVQASEVAAEVALVDGLAAMDWVRSVAWPSLKNSVAVGFQMATASGACVCVYI
jgi:hypothetical protein